MSAMKNSKYIILSIVIIIIGTIIGYKYIVPIEENKIDIVSINRIEKEAEKNWDELKDNKYKFNDNNMDFFIISNEGSILYSNYKIETQTYNSYIIKSVKNRDAILDIHVDNEIVGKLIIKDNSIDINKEKNNLIKLLFYEIGLLIIVLLLWIFHIYKVVINPFKRLESFAGAVARGNFDIPLNREKNNIFGAFTESFSIMREELKKAKEREYEANKSKKELIASLSHDIKTPVASIRAITEVMSITSSNEKDKEKLNIIYDKTVKIEKLVNDMFHSTLEELQELNVKCNSYDSRIITNIINESNYYNKITIVNNMPEALINVDKLRLSQVIDNIINNSYKYANTDIEVRYELVNNYLNVYIKDFGQGINEEEISLVFNKFYRGSNTNEKDGSGLGLYISKYLMNKMEGNISCYNENDGFVVILEIKLS